MINFIPRILLDKINEGGGSGGTGQGNPPESAQQQPPTANAPAPQAEGTKTDDFGYEKVSAADENKNADPKDAAAPKDEKLPDPKDIKENTTGYELDDKKVEPPPPPPPPAEPPAPPTEFDKKFEKLPKAVADDAKAEAQELGLEGEKLDKFIARREAMVAKNIENRQILQRQNQEAVQRQRAAWREELEKHPTFGGQNFKTNIVKAQKVLDDVMPETKKILTESKTMLPPYVMRDMAALYDRLHKAPSFVQGDPPAPPAAPQKSKLDEALEFYQ